MPEIIPLEQDRLAHRLCKSVSETVAEIQRRLVSAPLAEIPVRFTCNSRLDLGNRLDAQRRLLEEFVKPSARNRISATINHGGRFQIIGCPDTAGFCGRQ